MNAKAASILQGVLLDYCLLINLQFIMLTIMIVTLGVFMDFNQIISSTRVFIDNAVIKLRINQISQFYIMWWDVFKSLAKGKYSN